MGPAPQPPVMPPIHAELEKPALVPRTQEPLTEPNHALLPSLDSMLELPAPQPPVMPPIHAELAKPALEPRTPEPLMEPNPAFYPRFPRCWSYLHPSHR